MKNIKDLKQFIKKLPDDMPIGLLDTGSDNMNDTNYPLNGEVLEYVKEGGGPIAGNMLFFTFENKRVENLMGEWREKVEMEAYHLGTRISNLEAFLESDRIKKISIEMAAMMRVQLLSMKTYAECLEYRLGPVKYMDY